MKLDAGKQLRTYGSQDVLLDSVSRPSVAALLGPRYHLSGLTAVYAPQVIALRSYHPVPVEE